MRKHIFFILLFCIAAPAAISFASAGSDYMPERLRATTNYADYIVIAPPGFAGALEPLMDHRTADGHAVLLAATDRLADEFGVYGTGPEHIQAFIRYACNYWRRPAPRYVLLAGDALAPGATAATGLEIPTSIMHSIYRGNIDRGETIASDTAYGDLDGDGAPDLAVGRIPADSPDELSAVIEKIINYETWPPAGLWKRRLTFFASQGDFGAIDKVIEKMYMAIVRNNIDPALDVNMTYANPKMPYFFPPRRFNKQVIKRYDDGSLMMLYIGHGFTTGFDKVDWQGERYPIMLMEDAPLLDAAGRTPFMVIIACLTGNFDAPGTDSISEALLKNPGGPVGVFSASVISQPYSNTVLNMAVFKSVFKDRVPTLGMALLQAQRELLYGRKTEDRKLIERFGRSIHTKEEMLKHNRETVFMYNLLGDPATRIQLPPAAVAIDAPAIATAGDLISASGTVRNIHTGEVHIELACFPTDVIYPIRDIDGLEGPELEQAIEQNYQNANNKVAWEKVVDIVDGEFRLDIPLPVFLPRKIYFIKAFAFGTNGNEAIGYRPIRIKAQPPGGGSR